MASVVLPNPGGPDSLLGDLHRYYVAQGKSEELIAKFKQRLEKQPSSVQAYENLAQIYVMSANRQAALELYQQLSEKRAEAVRAYLVSQGASADKIEVFGFGKTLPVKSCPSAKGRKAEIECLAPNRRVQIEVQGLLR